MIYLVDFENTGNDGLLGVENLSYEDKLIIFVSAKSNRVNVLGLAQCKAPIHFVYSTTNGCHDYMDFQIATACGMLIVTDDVCIISNDNGYSAVSDFCKYNKLTNGNGKLFLQKNLTGMKKVNVSDKPLSHKRIKSLLQQSGFEIQEPPVAKSTQVTSSPAELDDSCIEEAEKEVVPEDAITEVSAITKPREPAPEKQFIEPTKPSAIQSLSEKEKIRIRKLDNALNSLRTLINDGQITHLKTFIYDTPKKKCKERVKQVVGKAKFEKVWGQLAKHLVK